MESAEIPQTKPRADRRRSRKRSVDRVSPIDKRCSNDNTQNLKETDSRAFPTSAGFEPAIPASKRPQTYALEGVATEIG